MMRRLLLLWWLLLSSPLVIAAERMTMAVSPARSFSPTNLEIRVHVAPDDSNRLLEVVVESDGYLRSGRVQLDGKDSPQNLRLEFRDVPSGDYVICGSVLDGTGRTRASARAEVIVLP
jgi:hypothetical protein